MQEQTTTPNLIASMTTLQSSDTSQVAHPATLHRAVDLGLLETIQTIQGLALRTERLAMDVLTVVTAATKRAEAEAGQLGALARAMTSLTQLTGESITEALTLIGNSPSESVTQGHIATGSQAGLDVMDLTEQEQELYKRHMTKVALDIVDMIGLPATMLLIEKCGGRRVWPFGKDLALLTATLGAEAAAKLKQWLGASSIEVPSCQSARKAVIHSRIRAEFDRLTMVEKFSSRMAMRRLMNFVSPPLSEHRIRQILNKGDELPKSPATPPSTSMGAGRVTVHRLR